MVKKQKNKSKYKSKYNYIFQEEKVEYYHNSKFNLRIDKSNIKEAGLGVFTNDFIPANTFIDYYKGNTCSGIKGGLYFFAINNIVGIDAQSYPRCYMAMLNDVYKSSFTVNCEFIIDEEAKTVEIYSCKNIEPDEELFISYGDSYWNN